MEEVFGTFAFVTILTFDLSPPCFNVWKQVLLPPPKKFGRELDVGLWDKPLFPSAETRLDCTRIVVNFGLIGRRKFVVHYVFREGRDLVWSQA